MSLHDSLTKLFNKLDVSSYGYKVNKWLTNGAFVLMILYLLVVVQVDGFGALNGGSWVECPSDAVAPCLNPYASSLCVSIPSFDGVGVVCESQYLQAGEVYGEKLSLFTRAFPFVLFAVFGFALLLNHLLFNRNFKVKKNEK